jgi:Icc-related predicted phosphoesterase
VKILCVSDIHQNHNELELVPCDVLIIAGDICTKGEIHEVESFASWLASQSHHFNKALIIAGNHDWAFMRFKVLAKDVLKNHLGDKVEYLEDSEAVIDDVKFYGSPWQPEFCSWAFNVPRGEKIRRIWKGIPDDVDVLITHGPPFGIGDKVYGNHVGCLELLHAVSKLPHLSIHVFGHVHAGNGSYISEEHPGTYFCNCSVCDENYVTNNPSYLFTLADTKPYRFTKASPVYLKRAKP